MGFCDCSNLCCALLCALSSFVIILIWNRELVALIYLSFRRPVTVIVLYLFFMVPLFGLQCVIVVQAFPDHTHFLL